MGRNYGKGHFWKSFVGSGSAARSGTTFVNSIVLIPCVLVLGIDPSRVIGAAEKSELPVISRIFVLESIEFNHAARLPARFRRNAGI